MVDMVDMGDNMDIVDSMNMVDSIDMGNMQKLSFLKVASRPFRMIMVDMYGIVENSIVDKMVIVDSKDIFIMLEKWTKNQDGTELLPIAPKWP